MTYDMRDNAAKHVIVVGGGIIGVSCAYFLAKRGARVTLLERDEIGKGASFGNAGTIAPGHAPINKPGRVRQALKSLFDPLSPLYVAPRWDPALVQWLLTFSRHCTHHHLEYSLNALAPLGHATVDLYDKLVTDEKLNCGYHRSGYYEAFLTEQGLAGACEEADLVRKRGFKPTVVSGDEVREQLPVLNDRISGGVFFPEASTVHPYRLVLELAERAVQYGASVEANSDVSDIVPAEGGPVRVKTTAGDSMEADRVVLATGAYSVPLFRTLGIEIPLQAAKGYHCDRVPAESETPALSNTCMLGEASVFCTPMDGVVRFAGTLEFSGVNHNIRRDRLDQLLNAARLYFDGVGEAEARSEWCGLRPCVADGLPAIGPIRRCPAVVVATGHGMLGLTLGPITGKLVAELLLDGKASLDVSPFRLARFG